MAAPNPATVLTSYNLWVAVWWYGLVVYDLLGTGFLNGTIHYAYFKHQFCPKTSISGTLGVILALLSSILVALGSPADSRAALWSQRWSSGGFWEVSRPLFGYPFWYISGYKSKNIC